MSGTVKKDIQTSLKFVYSENNTLSIIFKNNDILMGVVGEFNNNLKELEKITDTNIYSRGNSILVKRISGRISCSVCKKPFNEFFDPPGDATECTTVECKDRELIKRSDDNESTVSNRLKTYEESTLPLLEYYELKGIVKNVDAMKSINEVTNQINSIINDL